MLLLITENLSLNEPSLSTLEETPSWFAQMLCRKSSQVNWS